MKAFLGIVVLVGMPSLIATLGCSFKCSQRKERGKKILISKMTVFFLTFFYGVLSAVKFLLGDEKMTLRESFLDIWHIAQN